MGLSDLITADSIIPALRANSKKQLLQIMAEKAASISHLQDRVILQTILEREKLGSTGVGNGIAIPHGKMSDLDKSFGVFARLEHPVDFAAQDDRSVDLVFLLLAPEGAGTLHLKALSYVARVFRDPEMTNKLRHTHDAKLLYSYLIQYPAPYTA